MTQQREDYDRDFLTKATVRVFTNNDGEQKLVKEIQAVDFLDLNTIDCGLIGNVAAWLLLQISESGLLTDKTDYFCEVCFLRTTEAPKYRKSIYDPDNKWLVRATQCIATGKNFFNWGPLYQ